MEHIRHEGGEKLEAALQHRVQFWLDTCRDVREMRHPTRQVIDLHRQHGCRFRVPDSRQIQPILDALDGVLPRWDREHPELLYQTLELNHPELVRVHSSQRAQ